MSNKREKSRQQWEQEIRARIIAVDEGRAIGIPYEEVMQAAEDRLA